VNRSHVERHHVVVEKLSVGSDQIEDDGDRRFAEKLS